MHISNINTVLLSINYLPIMRITKRFLSKHSQFATHAPKHNTENQIFHIHIKYLFNLYYFPI
jgi:hypothetical protein